MSKSETTVKATGAKLAEMKKGSHSETNQS